MPSREFEKKKLLHLLIGCIANFENYAELNCIERNKVVLEVIEEILVMANKTQHELVLWQSRESWGD